MPEVPDFWPNDLGNANLLTPVTILRQEASYLGPKTNQLLKGEVSTGSSGDSFTHSFNIVAPGLNNYRYQLFQIQHSITLYPLLLIWSSANIQIASQESLITRLKEILSSPQTRQIIEALLAQVSRPGGAADA